METAIAHTEKSGSAAGTELFDELPDNPDLILLFPTTEEADSHGIQSLVNTLTAKTSCPVVGASVGGFATAETGELSLFGTAAVALQHVSFETKRIDNVWNADEEVLYNNLTGYDGTVLSFECGSRTGGDSTGWKLMKQLARHIIQKNTLGQRKRLINKMHSRLTAYEIGYTALFRARARAGTEGAAIVNYPSGDTGDMLNGYEIWNDTITQSKSATLVYLEERLGTGCAQTAGETLESGNVLESYDSLEHYKNVIYRFDGETLNNLADRFAINEEVGRGGFSYYLLLETNGSVYAVPFASDLGGVVPSYIPIDEDARAHLVRSPSFPEYKERYRQMLQEIGTGLPHISINPPQMDYFRDQLRTLVDMTVEEQDKFLITIDNSFRRYEDMEYNFPGYVCYE